jgi:hypothetical protein
MELDIFTQDFHFSRNTPHRCSTQNMATNDTKRIAYTFTIRLLQSVLQRNSMA